MTNLLSPNYVGDGPTLLNFKFIKIGYDSADHRFMGPGIARMNDSFDSLIEHYNREMSHGLPEFVDKFQCLAVAVSATYIITGTINGQNINRVLHRTSDLYKFLKEYVISPDKLVPPKPLECEELALFNRWNSKEFVRSTARWLTILPSHLSYTFLPNEMKEEVAINARDSKVHNKDEARAIARSTNK